LAKHFYVINEIYSTYDCVTGVQSFSCKHMFFMWKFGFSILFIIIYTKKILNTIIITVFKDWWKFL